METVAGQVKPPTPKCATAGADPEMWFPLAEETDELTYKSMRYARELCSGCPLIDQCLETALRTGENFGIWGGLTSFERRLLSEARVTLELLVPRLVAEEESLGVTA